MPDEVKGALTVDRLKELKQKFLEDEKNLLAQSACIKTDPFEVCMLRSVLEGSNQVFTHKVDCEAKPVTNQKNSGRCWIFAALNVMRMPFIKQFKLEDFEFSQSYLFFWDKLEKCNYYLNTIVEVLKRGEVVGGRLMSFLLQEPVVDGGQWDMIVNLIVRYGVMPKKCFPETYCSETSSRINHILKTKVREFTKDLTVMYEKESTDDEFSMKISTCMEELYRVIAICLSVPPETFKWEYYDTNKVYCSVGPITPLQFYNEYVKPCCDIENKICFVHDPRPENPFGQTYTIDCLGNVIGGRRVIYLNMNIEEVLKYTAESIKNNEPVWFGCEVNSWCPGKLGIQDMKLHNFPLLFGTDVHQLTKAEKLIYGDSSMNHAMVLTGVSLDADGEPTKWRIENSWGDDRGDKGFIMMTSDWFRQAGYEVAIDKKYVPKEVLELANKEPVVLPAWDPMGSLAE